MKKRYEEISKSDWMKENLKHSNPDAFLSGVSGSDFDVYSTKISSKGNGGYQHAIQNKTIVIKKDDKRIELDEKEIMQVLKAVGVAVSDFEKGFH